MGLQLKMSHIKVHYLTAETYFKGNAIYTL